MDTEQARSIVAQHDTKNRALLNLRNAAAMSSDDPRATEMLENAGDAYAAAQTKLAEVNARASAALNPYELPQADIHAADVGEAPTAPAGGDQSLSAGGSPSEDSGGSRTPEPPEGSGGTTAE